MVVNVQSYAGVLIDLERDLWVVRILVTGE